MAASRDEQDREGWAFGPFEFWADRGLVRDGADVEIATKPLAMLEHLLRHRDRVVSRDEFRDLLWPDVAVSEAAFDSVLRDLRRALGDSAARSTFVATVRGRGLSFVGLARKLPVPNAGSWREAAVHFERALQALDLLERGSGRVAPREHRERADLLVALARAQWAGGQTADARRAFLDAAAVGRAASDGEILARAALGFAGRTDITPGVNADAVTLMEEALAALPPDVSPLRAEVMARLATELYYASEPERSLELANGAVRMAEQADDPSVHAYALTAFHFVRQVPQIAPAERLASSEPIFELVPEDPPSDVLALALHQRCIDLLELGEGARFRAALERYFAVARALEQPFFLWSGSLLESTRLLLEGEIAAAEEAAHRSLDLGQRVGSPNALAAFAGQLFGVRREQGRLGELASVMDELAESADAMPIFRAGRAAVLVAAGQGAQARDALEGLASDLSGFPRDQNWLPTLGTLAPAVASQGTEALIRQVRSELAPYEDRIIVVGQGATTHGAVSHHLGLLAEALGEQDEAARCFADAMERHRRLGAHAWVDRARRSTG